MCVTIWGCAQPGLSDIALPSKGQDKKSGQCMLYFILRIRSLLMLDYCIETKKSCMATKRPWTCWDLEMKLAKLCYKKY